MRRLILAVAAATALLAGLLAAPASAAYLGNEGQLAFVRANQIYTVASTGVAVKKLTSSAKNYRPKWSPDGKRIAYIHEVASGSRDVWVMKANGTGKTRVTHVGDVSAAAVWSPDGNALAFGSGAPPFDAFLFTIKSTSPFGSPAPVIGYLTGCSGCTDDPTDLAQLQVDRFLAWSADGSHIAIFNHDDGGPDDAIFIYDVATGQAAEHGATGGECCGFLEWSDLVWGTDGAFGYGEVNTGFDGTDPYVRIVYPGFASVEGDRSPAPSPSNAHLAFTNTASGTPKIYVSTIHGAQRHLVVSDGYQPDWQPLP
jgi:Tol biopolymer transport system component